MSITTPERASANQYQFYRTAESVSPGHPDKLCDQISDAILDAYFEKDPNARVAAETCGGHGVVFVTGEITSTANDNDIDIEKIVKRIAGDNLEVHTKIVKQSPEIAQGVDRTLAKRSCPLPQTQPIHFREIPI